MIRINLDYSGHCPQKTVEVTEEQLAELNRIQKVYGEIECANGSGTEAEKQFIGEICALPPVDSNPTFCVYA